jgi:hypothetical protein
MTKTLTPRVEIVRVTPDIAVEYLTRLGPDRVRDQTWTDQLTTAMLRGRYSLMWDAIAFDTNGRLRNGQHRLAAIVASGTSQLMIVLWDIPADALLETTGDQGRKRTFKQILEMRGESNPGVLAPATRYLWQYLSGRAPGARDTRAKGSAILFDETLAQHPMLREHVARGQRLTKQGKLGSSGLGTLLSYLLVRTNPDDAERFLDKLVTLDGLSEHDPIMVLHQMLVTAHGNSGESKGSDVGHKYAWTINAWNLWVRGDAATTRRLRWSPQRQPLPLPDVPGVELPLDLRVERVDE